MHERSEHPDTDRACVVLGEPFSIVSVPHRASTDDGQCDLDEHRIYVSDGLTPRRSVVVLAHEQIHAALYISSISEQIDNESLEDNICVVMSYYVAQLLRRNGLGIEALMESTNAQTQGEHD